METFPPLWTYRCQGPVNSIDAGDLDGDGRLEVVVGSDDYHVHALDSDGQPRWKWKAPFDELKATIMYCWWMWPEPFVRKVVVHDLNNAGKAEIITGAGMVTMLATFKAADDRRHIAAAGGYTNWLTALDTQGERQWAVYFDTHVVALTVDQSIAYLLR